MKRVLIELASQKVALSEQRWTSYKPYSTTVGHKPVMMVSSVPKAVEISPDDDIKKLKRLQTKLGDVLTPQSHQRLDSRSTQHVCIHLRVSRRLTRSVCVL